MEEYLNLSRYGRKFLEIIKEQPKSFTVTSDFISWNSEAFEELLRRHTATKPDSWKAYMTRLGWAFRTINHKETMMTRRADHHGTDATATASQCVASVSLETPPETPFETPTETLSETTPSETPGCLPPPNSVVDDAVHAAAFMQQTSKFLPPPPGSPCAPLSPVESGDLSNVLAPATPMEPARKRHCPPAPKRGTGGGHFGGGDCGSGHNYVDDIDDIDDDMAAVNCGRSVFSCIL